MCTHPLVYIWMPFNHIILYNDKSFTLNFEHTWMIVFNCYLNRLKSKMCWSCMSRRHFRVFYVVGCNQIWQCVVDMSPDLSLWTPWRVQLTMGFCVLTFLWGARTRTAVFIYYFIASEETFIICCSFSRRRTSSGWMYWLGEFLTHHHTLELKRNQNKMYRYIRQQFYYTKNNFVYNISTTLLYKSIKEYQKKKKYTNRKFVLTHFVLKFLNNWHVSH